MPNDWDKEQLATYEAQQLTQKQNETRSVLDVLRATRKSRGGTGAPLQVPAHLKEAAEGKPSVVLTDADLKTGDMKLSTPIGGQE